MAPLRQRRPVKKNPTRLITQALGIFSILTFAATSSEVSQLCLSPVYGSVLAPYYINWELSVVFVAWATKVSLSKRQTIYLKRLLPILGCSIGAVQSFLFQYSGYLGPRWGPLMSGILTSLPIIYLSLLHAAELPFAIVFPKLLTKFGSKAVDLAVICLSYTVLIGLRQMARFSLQSILGYGPIFSRYGLQAILACLYCSLARYKIEFLTLPILLYLAFSSVHLPFSINTAPLNVTLQAEGYSLVARQESLTGYISVLDNVKDGFRAMRCDHSLLGGEWTNMKHHLSNLNEPIYSVFVMLEAVRLIETESSKDLRTIPNGNERALVM